MDSGHSDAGRHGRGQGVGRSTRTIESLVGYQPLAIVPGVRPVDDTFGRRRIVGDVVRIRRRRFVVQLGMERSFGAVGIGYQRAPAELLHGHLGLCYLLLDVAKLSVLEQYLDVELLLDGGPYRLQTRSAVFGGVSDTRGKVGKKKKEKKKVKVKRKKKEKEKGKEKKKKEKRKKKREVPGGALLQLFFTPALLSAPGTGIVWTPLSSTMLLGGATFDCCCCCCCCCWCCGGGGGGGDSWSEGFGLKGVASLIFLLAGERATTGSGAVIRW